MPGCDRRGPVNNWGMLRNLLGNFTHWASASTAGLPPNQRVSSHSGEAKTQPKGKKTCHRASSTRVFDEQEFIILDHGLTILGLARSTVILKTSLSRALNRQNKHRNTNQNTMTAILWVFISFSSVLKLLNFGFSFANLINWHSHYKCTTHHTNRGW